MQLQLQLHLQLLLLAAYAGFDAPIGYTFTASDLPYPLGQAPLAAFEKCYSGFGICGFVLLLLPQPLSAFGRRLAPCFCQFAWRFRCDLALAKPHCTLHIRTVAAGRPQSQMNSISANG